MKPDTYRPTFEWTTSPLRSGKIALYPELITGTKGEGNLITEMPLFHCGARNPKPEDSVVNLIASTQGHGREVIHVDCQTLSYNILPVSGKDEYVTATRTSYGPTTTRYIDGHIFSATAPSSFQDNLQIISVQDKKRSRLPVIFKTLEITDPQREGTSSGICLYQLMAETGHQRKDLFKRLCDRAKNNAFDLSHYDGTTPSKAGIVKGIPHTGKGYDRHHYDEPEHITVPTMIENALLIDFGQRTGFVQKLKR